MQDSYRNLNLTDINMTLWVHMINCVMIFNWTAFKMQFMCYFELTMSNNINVLKESHACFQTFFILAIRLANGFVIYGWKTSIMSRNSRWGEFLSNKSQFAGRSCKVLVNICDMGKNQEKFMSTCVNICVTFWAANRLKFVFRPEFVPYARDLMTLLVFLSTSWLQAFNV